MKQTKWLALGTLAISLAGCARDPEPASESRAAGEPHPSAMEAREVESAAPPSLGVTESPDLARESEGSRAGADLSERRGPEPILAAGTPPAASALVPTPTANTPPAAEDPRAEQILERAERAYDRLRSLEADFTQEVFIPLLETTQASRGKIYHRAPDRFLMRFTEPQGDVVVADGRYLWMYYPSNDPRQVMRGRLAEGGQQVDLQREFLSDATTRFSAQLDGRANAGGRSAYALTLVPRGPSPYRLVRIWVDTEDSLVRRFEITEQNETRRTLEMSNLRPNVALADDLFSFTPPPGAQVFEP